MVRAISSFLCALLVPILTDAQTTLPATQPAVAPLIHQLGDESFQVRDEAQAALVNLGPDAEAALHNAVLHSIDPEIRSRAAAAITRIEQDGIDAPTLITLHATDEGADTVMADISRQANVDIQYFNQPDWPMPPHLTLNLDRVPFWAAMSEFCQKANVRPQPMGAVDPSIINLLPNNIAMPMGANVPFAGIRDDQGRFIVFANSLVRNRVVNLGNGSVIRNDQLVLSVVVDPKFKIIAHGFPHLDVVDDDNGASWIAPPPAGIAASRIQFRDLVTNWSFNAAIPLAAPARAATKLTLIKGSIPALMGIRTDTLQLDDLSKEVGKVHPIGDRMLQITACNFAPGRCELGLNIVLPAPTVRPGVMPGFDPVALSREQRFATDLRVLRICDSEGNRIRIVQNAPLRNNQFDCTISFPSPGPPISLKWQVVTATAVWNIPFEFKDIPLPQN